MINTMLLAADWEPITKLVVTIIAFSIYWLNHILSANKAKQQAQPQAMKRKLPAPQNPAPRPNQAAGNQKGLSDEIEQFLRRAADRKRDKQGPAPPQPQRQPKSRQTVSRPAGPPVLEVVSEAPTGEAVRASVAKHLDTKQFTERAENLIDDMKRADVEREQHFQQAFSHQVGRLAGTGGAALATTEQVAAITADAPAAAASGIILMLRSPEGLRQAIAINEILRRPVHRW